ncbi:hypothetical protein D3C81_1238630 [compost metagenome]
MQRGFPQAIRPVKYPGDIGQGECGNQRPIQVLITHMFAPALERRLAEKTILFGIQIVVFDVGINVVIFHMPHPPIIRVYPQRQRHQPPRQSVGPGGA